MTCDTDASGTCTVSYTPLLVGTDVWCALASGSHLLCDEPVGQSRAQR